MGKILILIVFCLNGLAFANQPSPVTVDEVSVTPEASQPPGKNFSLSIKLMPTKTISHWALGFYMPRSFDQLINKQMNVATNADLIMEICDANVPAQCSPLKLVKNPQTYATEGYTTVLSPADSSLKLMVGKTYLIKLTNSNRGMPTNYSAMPQSFFIIEKGDKITPLANVPPDHYEFTNYQAEQIRLAVAKHNIDNWFQTKPKIANSLADQYHLVPTPASISLTNQPGFSFSQQSHLTVTDEFTNYATNSTLLAAYLKHDFNITLVEQANNSAITFQKIQLNNPEGYHLIISKNSIVIAASTPAGIFYGLQTLRQLWSQNKVIPGLIIEDSPRYKYRGIMLDVARHFFTINEIEKLMDVMAAQKLNTLHIHFADDEGWRLVLAQNQTDPLNKLTAVGGARGFNTTTKLPPAEFGQANLDISNRKNFSPAEPLIQADFPTANARYAGSYSAADIKSLIAYANARQITIIPEVDLPGHARALIYSMPEIFQDTNDKSIFSSVQNYTADVIPVCLYHQQVPQGKQFTATVDEIIHRINDLFARQTTVYHTDEVSLAGDEVSKLAWTDDSSCTGKWSALSALDKSHYFFSLLQPHTLLSGWQQLVQEDDGSLGKDILPSNNVGHVWVWEVSGTENKLQGITNAANLINAGYPTVLAFADDTYFDITYTPDVWEPGFKWAGAYSDTHAALRAAFHASQTEQLVNPNQRDNLLGLEGALWSENLTNFAHLAYMALPKMAGLAEAAWASADITTNPEGKLNWQSLVYRLGTDNPGFLAYLYQASQMKYRGYPHGISAEIPIEDERP